jgi:hypothetical protein
MITFATIPKPFEGHVEVIQNNAIASWLRVAPEVHVVLIGDDPGVAEAARRFGVDHQPHVERNEYGTPLLDSALALASEKSLHRLMCYVNTDIVMPRSLAGASDRVAAHADRFLVVGECWNVRVEAPLDPTDEHIERLMRGGEKRGPDALDYFLFTKGVFDDIPPFAVGRTAWDNWLVWKARADGALVVDATWVVRAIHQDHTYAHVGSLSKVRVSPEADENRRLTGGGRDRLYSRLDATHRLTPWGLVPSPLAVGHTGETARRAWAKLGYVTGLRHA